jgi:hypothetical protein
VTLQTCAAKISARIDGVKSERSSVRHLLGPTVNNLVSAIYDGHRSKKV